MAERAGSQLRLGIAGCGRIVERGYLAALRALPGVSLAAVADADRARAAQVARAAGGTGTLVHANAAELLAGSTVDALLVAVPSTAHLQVATAAAEAGVPSLVEKPPAPDLAGAAALASLAPRPSIGFNRRFLQGAELLPLVPDEGWLELELELRFDRGGWGSHLSRDEALLDAGTHLIDLAIFLAGAAPIAVRRAAVECDRAELELELGRARARIRCATDRAYSERVEVSDRSGRSLASSRIGRFGAAWRRLRGGEDPLVGSLRRQLDRFAIQVCGGEAGPLADAEDGATALAVVEAARRSAALGGAEVTVEPARRGASAAGGSRP